MHIYLLYTIRYLTYLQLLVMLDTLLCSYNKKARQYTKGPPGPGGHNNLSNSVLEGLLYFISPLY